MSNQNESGRETGSTKENRDFASKVSDDVYREKDSTKLTSQISEKAQL